MNHSSSTLSPNTVVPPKCAGISPARGRDRRGGSATPCPEQIVHTGCGVSLTADIPDPADRILCPVLGDGPAAAGRWHQMPHWVNPGCDTESRGSRRVPLTRSRFEPAGFPPHPRPRVVLTRPSCPSHPPASRPPDSPQMIPVPPQTLLVSGCRVPLTRPRFPLTRPRFPATGSFSHGPAPPHTLSVLGRRMPIKRSPPGFPPHAPRFRPPVSPHTLPVKAESPGVWKALAAARGSPA